MRFESAAHSRPCVVAAAVCLGLWLGGSVLGAAEEAPGRRLFVWPGFEESAAKPLPDLPEPLGAAGPFVGVSRDALIVAGGAHFQVSPFQGGKKIWLRTIRVLAKTPDGGCRWHTAERTLDGPLAYGASVTTADGVVCLGGQDAERCYRTVFRLAWDPERKAVTCEPLPELPEPCANHAAALVGSTVYVAGGQSSPTATQATKTFWALDLSKKDATWETLPWPEGAPARILAMAAAQSNAKSTLLYLFGGAELIADAPGRRFLRDAYACNPAEKDAAKRWRRVADLPETLAAAMALAYGPYHILLFGGDTGALFARNQELGDKHPGFPRAVWAYHTVTDTWARMGEMPAGRVTTTAVPWGDGLVIPSGEDRPGHRSPQLLLALPRPHKARFALVDYAVIVAYLAAMVWIGFRLAGREKTTDDFFLAGRRIPWWAAGLSIYATQLSAITFLSIPATVFALDWLPFMANMTIFLIAPVIVYFYLPFFRRLNVTTAYEYLEKRFHVVVRLWGSVSFILFQLGRMGIVLLLPAIALSAGSGLNLYLCIAVMGVLATVYTVMGGIEAVIWTDVVQAGVLLGGALVSVFVIAGRVDGGFGGMVRIAAADGKFRMFDWTWDWTVMAAWVVVVGNLFGNLVPYTTDQAVVQRYLTTKDEKAAARGIWTNGLLCIPGSLIFFFIGTALYAFFKTHPQTLEPGLQADAIFPLFIANELPAGVVGLVIAGVFAASMSTLDSSMNSVATALVTDFYRRFRPAATDRTCLRLAQWVTVVTGVAATGASLFMGSYGGHIKSLWFLFVMLLGLLGGALAGIFALAIFSRRASSVGALVGAVAGIAATVAVWQGNLVHFYLWPVVGVVVTYAVGWVVSLAVPSRKDLTGLTLYTIGKRE
jgi:solute:Na+ symporter, SSS family